MGNVAFLFGLNGIGKSTLMTRLIELMPGSIGLNGSAILRTYLGLSRRSELEQMDQRRKYEAKSLALTSAFTAHRDAPLIVCDTHLVVPIRNSNGTRYETMWHPSFSPFLRCAVHLTAPTEAIRDRRLRDAARTGRIRPTDLQGIAADQRANTVMFHSIFTDHPRALTIDHHDVERTVAALIVLAS